MYHTASLEVSKHSAPPPEQLDHGTAAGEEEDDSDVSQQIEDAKAQMQAEFLAAQAAERTRLMEFFTDMQKANAEAESPEKAEK